MSKATKRKHVTREVVEEFRLPSENEKIVKVICGKGNNLHEVVDQHGESYLVSMPTKFRKNVWIKRGDFVLVSSIPEGDKVKGEISTILYKEQLKYLRSQGVWPAVFETTPPTAELGNLEIKETGDSVVSSDEDNELFENTNRPTYDASSEESSESDEDD